MEITATFKLTYDRHRDGTVKDFNEKKYKPYKAHIERMQAQGLLPERILFSIETVGGTPKPPRPDGPARVVGFVPLYRKADMVPALVHEAGQRLFVAPPAAVAAPERRIDPERIAI